MLTSCGRWFLASFLVSLVTVGFVEAESLSMSRRLWVATGADNSTERASGIFSSRGSVLRTSSELTNIHAHYKVTTVRSPNFILSGEMMIAEEGGGVGVTFHSQYLRSDTYYRLRSSPSEQTFHIAPHPDGVQEITSGTSDSGVIPTPGRWYRFKIWVKNFSTLTSIRAKIWSRSQSEPRRWQINCQDSSTIRLKRGRLGVWSMGVGEKRWRNFAVRDLTR